MSALSTRPGREVSEMIYVDDTCPPGPTYIWTFNLKTREKSSKWVLAGVALLLQI